MNSRLMNSRVMKLYLRVNQALWKRLPPALHRTRPLRWYGTILHELVRRRAKRQQYFGTFFLRNRAELEQIRRLTAVLPQDSELRLAILGCSIGAEVYSVLWAVRTARSDLRVHTSAVDISAQVLAIAQKAVYSSEHSGMVGSSIFERLRDAERDAIFDWQEDVGTVKPWIREGIGWHLGDANDPSLVRTLGAQDIVLASNFLCHMDPTEAERCLRNIARLVKPGGHIIVLGVDLDVREKVAHHLGWHPLPELIREIHDGDPVLRHSWPWEWWGLEPLNDRRPDWQLRYAAAYRVD
jgi:chemotaxis methyl-accepting protein methylase